MGKKVLLRACSFGADTGAIITALQARGVIPAGVPRKVQVDDQPADAPSWLARIAAAKRQLVADWEGDNSVIADARMVQLTTEGYDLEAEKLAELLADVPFELASFATLWALWPNAAKGPGYKAPIFPDAPWNMGWGCAFRGKGHDRVVSRRWLDYGPWRTLRGANDTTLVQFHDLAADLKTSAEQAAPGHKRLSMFAEGGMLQRPDVFKYTLTLSGLYHEVEHKLRIVVGRREISAAEMRDSAAARNYQALGAGKPIDNVIYVFADADNLQKYLPTLWRYGVEVNQVDGAGERRVDDAYQPPAPDKPDWVKALGRDDRVTAEAAKGKPIEPRAAAPAAAAAPPAKPEIMSFARTKLALTADFKQRLTAVVERDAASFAPRLANLEVDVIQQPFFKQHEILDVVSPVPMPSRRIHVARTPQGELMVLTGQLAHLTAIAAADRPEGLSDPKLASNYAIYCDGWTTESPLGEFKLASVDDIPWWANLDDAMKAKIQDVKDTLGPEIKPQQLFFEPGRWQVHFWLVANQRLIERTLIVPLDGQLRRLDKVHREDLPIPPGKMWKMIKNRLTPAG